MAIIYEEITLIEYDIEEIIEEFINNLTLRPAIDVYQTMAVNIGDYLEYQY